MAELLLALALGGVKTSIKRSVWGKIPLGRIGEVSDVAKMAVVFVSDVTDYVIGTTVFVNRSMTDDSNFAHGG